MLTVAAPLFFGVSGFAATTPSFQWNEDDGAYQYWSYFNPGDSTGLPETTWFAYNAGGALSNISTGALTSSAVAALPDTTSGYLYHRDAAPDYSFGTINSTSSGTSYFGVKIENSTGSTLTDFSFRFITPTGLNVGYYVGDSALGYAGIAASSWAVAGFSTAAPDAKDYSAWLSGLSLNNGQSLFLRWENATKGSAYVDDVVISASAAVPEPSTYALLLGAGTLGLVGWRRFRRK